MNVTMAETVIEEAAEKSVTRDHPFKDEAELARQVNDFVAAGMAAGFIMARERGETDADAARAMIALATRRALEKGRYVESSSSMVHNMRDRYELAAWADAAVDGFGVHPVFAAMHAIARGDGS